MQFGFWSLVPPLLTIALALLTKNVFVSLLIGILTGSFVLNAFSPLVSINAGIYAIADSMTTGNTLIIASCLIIGAVIHLMEVSGGIDGFVNVVVKKRYYQVQAGSQPLYLGIGPGGVHLRLAKLHGHRCGIPAGKRCAEGAP